MPTPLQPSFLVGLPTSPGALLLPSPANERKKRGDAASIWFLHVQSSDESISLISDISFSASNESRLFSSHAWQKNKHSGIKWMRMAKTMRIKLRDPWGPVWRAVWSQHSLFHLQLTWGREASQLGFRNTSHNKLFYLLPFRSQYPTALPALPCFPQWTSQAPLFGQSLMQTPNVLPKVPSSKSWESIV